MNPEQTSNDLYHEMTAMVEKMRQDLEEIEAIKTKLLATDTRTWLTQTEVKSIQKELQDTRGCG